MVGPANLPLAFILLLPLLGRGFYPNPFSLLNRHCNAMSAPVDFERRELLRNLQEIESVEGSWFRLTALGKQRFATLILNLIEASTRDYSRVDLRGRWVLRLNNQDAFRFWLKGMHLELHFKGDIDEPNNFEKIIVLPTPISSIRLEGNYTVIGGSTTDEPTVEYCYDRAVARVFGRDIEIAWSGCEELGSAYIDNKLWIGKFLLLVGHLSNFVCRGARQEWRAHDKSL